MPTEVTPPVCPNCQAQLVEATAKNNSKYWRCPNWKPFERGCKGFNWFPPRKRSPSNVAQVSQLEEKLNDIGMVLEEMNDSLIFIVEYIKEKQKNV